MGRVARVVVAGAPHHVTQRGNRRQATFFCDADYRAWLAFAAEAFAAAQVSVWAYCLMPNHVHVIAAPGEEDALARAFGATSVRYTRMINAREGWTGYLWQGRFASFPMDEVYLRRCVRYVGLNPVRAGLVERAIDWPWSSVRAHLGGRRHRLLTPEPVAGLLGEDVVGFFDTDLAEEERRLLRKASRDGRPLGEASWVKALEVATGRVLAAPRRGRPPASGEGKQKGDTH
jgi:putative transposase